MRTTTNTPNATHPIAVRNEGQRLLRAAGTAEDVAAELECSVRSVEGWRSGKVAPSPLFERKMEELLEIPRAAWRQRPQLVQQEPFTGYGGPVWQAAEAAIDAALGERFPWAHSVIRNYLDTHCGDPARAAAASESELAHREEHGALIDQVEAAEAALAALHAEDSDPAKPFWPARPAVAR